MARGNFPDKIRFGPEPAADTWGDDSYFMLGDIHELEQGAPDAVRPLARRPDREKAFLALVLRDDAAGLDGMTAAAMDAEGLFNHMVGLGKRLVDVAGGLFHVSGDVVGLALVHQRRVFIQRSLDIDRGSHPSRSRLAPAARRPRRSADRSQR